MTIKRLEELARKCEEAVAYSGEVWQAVRRANSGKQCACGQPMGAQAKRCRRCNGLDMAAHQQPRVYQKPPDEYKMKHMTKAEKKTVEFFPMADTQDERAGEITDRLNAAKQRTARWLSTRAKVERKKGNYCTIRVRGRDRPRIS